uniref:Uncharacterized protein n=1 Tax=Photinus pyralis TaxID=7054 RepID=A0A1Y1KFH9_PHOPY
MYHRPQLRLWLQIPILYHHVCPIMASTWRRPRDMAFANLWLQFIVNKDHETTTRGPRSMSTVLPSFVGQYLLHLSTLGVGGSVLRTKVSTSTSCYNSLINTSG